MAAHMTITKKERKKEKKEKKRKKEIKKSLKHSLSYFLKENDTRINDTHTQYLE